MMREQYQEFVESFLEELSLKKEEFLSYPKSRLKKAFKYVVDMYLRQNLNTSTMHHFVANESNLNRAIQERAIEKNYDLGSINPFILSNKKESGDLAYYVIREDFLWNAKRWLKQMKQRASCTIHTGDKNDLLHLQP